MGVAIVEGSKIDRIAAAVERIAIAQAPIDVTDYEQIRQIVQLGLAQQYFKIGDQIVVPWSDGTNTYDMPMDVVSFGPATDGNNVVHNNAMWLQSHYALPGVQFSGNNAFYVPTAEMPIGTYYFTIGNNWGSNCVQGKIYEFTTTKKIPANGQLVLGTASSNTSGLPDTAPANWRVRTFANGLQVTPDEILSLTEVESSSGTNLGILSSSTKYATSGINNMQRSAYGYNRWSVSAIRQWLNSSAAANEWWTQKYAHDHRPDQLATMRGFEAGLPAEFLSIVQPVKMTTALNTVSDTDIGTSEDTVDRFFLPSLQQESCQPQVADIEGTAWQYWIDRLGKTQAQYETLPAHIRYLISNHSSAQYVRLRSAVRGSANDTWRVYSSGYVYYGGSATTAHCPAPACVIC